VSGRGASTGSAKTAFTELLEKIGQVEQELSELDRLSASGTVLDPHSCGVEARIARMRDLRRLLFERLETTRELAALRGR
jgi:hypothetical protein